MIPEIGHFALILALLLATIQGTLGPDGTFRATEVLAKHDENYMPPEAKAALEQAQRNGGSMQSLSHPGGAQP